MVVASIRYVATWSVGGAGDQSDRHGLALHRVRNVLWHTWRGRTVRPRETWLPASHGPQAQEHNRNNDNDDGNHTVFIHSEFWKEKVTGRWVNRRKWSGCRDSNPGPPAPQAGALARLRYIPMSTTFDIRRATPFARRRLGRLSMTVAAAAHSWTRTRDRVLNGTDGGTSCSSGVSTARHLD